MARPKSISPMTRADQKKLALLAARPDIPKVMGLRMRVLEWYEQKLPWILERLEHNLEHATRETDPQTRLLMSVLDRIIPALRENAQTPEGTKEQQQRGGSATIKIFNVNRGTEQARKAAITIEATKREAFEAKGVG